MRAMFVLAATALGLASAGALAVERAGSAGWVTPQTSGGAALVRLAMAPERGGGRTDRTAVEDPREPAANGTEPTAATPRPLPDETPLSGAELEAPPTKAGLEPRTPRLPSAESTPTPPATPAPRGETATTDTTGEARTPATKDSSKTR